MVRQLPKLVYLTLAGLSMAMTAVAQLVSAPQPQPATIIGTVLDVNDGIVPGAKVVLRGPGPDDCRTVIAGDDAFFRVENIAPGSGYEITVSAPEFADWTSSSITLTPGQYSILKDIKLHLATVQISVNAIDSEQLATKQVQAEEKQRVLGIVPNFYVNLDPNPQPLSPRLKFHLARKVLTDPVMLGGFVVNAGLYQMADYPRYRGGMEGYGQRLGASFAGGYTHVLVGDALLPSLLHQEPRYFYQGTGTTRSRAMHALSQAIFTTGDNGRRQINYSGIGGDLIAASVANAYYPQADRGGAVVVRGALIGTAGRIAFALSEEFVLNRHATRPTN